MLVADADILAQDHLSVPTRCRAIDKAKPALYLSFLSASQPRNRSSDRALLLRLSNDSRCDVEVATITYYGPRKNKKVYARYSVPDGARVKIVYSVDDDWGWGHSLLVLKLSSRRSLAFSIPFDELQHAWRITVPINFLGSKGSRKAENYIPFTSTDIPSVSFNLDELPDGVLKSIRNQ
jgi:hypothetical protein